MSALLDVRDLCAGYGDVAVLREVNFAVADGAITAIIGSNGSGKSTAMRTVAGLLPARSGQIYFAGRDLTATRPSERVEAGLALVPDGRLLFPEFTVEETLRVGAYCARTRAGTGDRMARMYESFSAFARATPQPCRCAVRRRAANAGDRPRFDVGAAPRAARRAEASAWRPQLSSKFSRRSLRSRAAARRCLSWSSKMSN